jgi:hypothetical protein
MIEIIGQNAALVAPNVVRVWTGPRFARVDGIWYTLAQLLSVRDVPTGWSFSAGGKTGSLLCDQPVELAAATASKVLTPEVFGPTIDAKMLTTGVLTFRVVLPAGAKETPAGWEIANIDGVSLGLGLGDWKALGPMVVNKGVVTLDLRAAKAKAQVIDLDPVTVLTPSGVKYTEDQASCATWALERLLRWGATSGSGLLYTSVANLGGAYDVGRGCLSFANCPANAVAARLYVNRASGDIAGTDNIVSYATIFDKLAASDNGTTINDLGRAYDSYVADAAYRQQLVAGTGTWFYADLDVAHQYNPGGTSLYAVSNRTYDVLGAEPPGPAAPQQCIFTATGTNQPHLDVTTLATFRHSPNLAMGLGL